MHTYTLKNGKVVEYHEDNRVKGLVVNVKTKLTKDEAMELYNYFDSERDLFIFRQNCKCSAYCS